MAHKTWADKVTKRMTPTQIDVGLALRAWILTGTPEQQRAYYRWMNKKRFIHIGKTARELKLVDGVLKCSPEDEAMALAFHMTMPKDLAARMRALGGADVFLDQAPIPTVSAKS